MARRKTDTDQLKIRLPFELRKGLEKAANEARRSLNAEIVTRLNQTFIRGGMGQLNKMAKTFLDLAIDVVSPLGSEPTPQELERRKLYGLRVDARLAPVSTVPIMDTDLLVRWMKLDAEELRERGRAREAERMERTAQVVEVALGVVDQDTQETAQSAPSQEPELPMPRMPRRESSK